MLSTIPALIPTDNPRLVELARLVAARIDRGYDYLTACKLVSAKVDMSLSLVSEAYDYVVGIGDYPSVPSAEDLGDGIWEDTLPVSDDFSSLVDPYDTTVDDWNENYWR
jgi:hypothetical protein